MADALPYQIAVLCYLFDADGRVLLIHRHKQPNKDLYSPVGGKLDRDVGESPGRCAQREIREETGLSVAVDDLHLTGLITETGYEGQSHWLMFLYELTRPVSVAPRVFNEGRLEWHARDQIDKLPIPATDANVIWPMFWRHRGGFFHAHIDCTDDQLRWCVEQALDRGA